MIGSPAPDCVLIDQGGSPFRLSQVWKNGPACLVFYPGDDTPVCTQQLCEYRDRWSDFTAAGASVVGINPAAHARHAGFAARHSFPYPLLSDPDRICCAAYGAKGWFGTRRLVVVVDRAGIVRYRRAVVPWRRQRADELMQALHAAR